MSSLLTNTSAMNALTTLKSINRDLEETSNRISTGQRVSSASDNAAYWSIATTVRTDNKSLGAVKDVLGLGAATVDTSYNGLNSTIEDMKELRSKLTAALAPNVDRSKVQVEIDAIQSKMKATADSSVMSGQNWLSVNSADTAVYKSTQQVVAGFSRDSSGNIAFSSVDIDVASIKLYDSNATSVTTAATEAKVTGDRSLTGTTAFRPGTANAGTADFTGTATTGNEVNFSITLNGGATATITLNAATLGSAVQDLSKVTTDELIGAINNQISASGAANLQGKVTAGLDSQGRLTFQTTATGSAASVTVTNVAETNAGKAQVDIGFGVLTTNTVTGNGTAAGTTTAQGILDTNVGTYTAGGSYSINTLDISNLSGTSGDNDLRSMITAVDKALAKMTDAATKLGASKTQISGQSAFVDTLMKANERTIGTLVDADMEEESTRLKALQTQQQLGVQSLSIANSATQNVLSLFR